MKRPSSDLSFNEFIVNLSLVDRLCMSIATWERESENIGEFNILRESFEIYFLINMIDNEFEINLLLRGDIFMSDDV